MLSLRHAFTSFALTAGLVAGSLNAAEKPAGLDQSGKVALKSAGPLAFGPEGVLFIGDPQGAALYAIGVESGEKAAASEFHVEAISAKLAAALGTKPTDILINDLAVQPGSGVAFLSVSRGLGPDAAAVIAKVTPAGDVSVVDLDKANYAKVSLTNVPDEGAKDRRGNSVRKEAITDLHFVDGRVFIAGLSNEEFASKLRAVTFPFESADLGTSIEIYHGAHGKFETQAPVRTFTPFTVNGEPHLLAAYTCTPLVTIPLSQLKAGAKLRGTTIAELGNQNRPLDIISYEKDGQNYLLLANSARGVMKITTQNIDKQSGITDRIQGTAGLNYETISSLKGVEQLEKLGDKSALLLVRGEDKSLSLQSIALP